jgi:hypothetical protein
MRTPRAWIAVLAVGIGVWPAAGQPPEVPKLPAAPPVPAAPGQLPEPAVNPAAPHRVNGLEIFVDRPAADGATSSESSREFTAKADEKYVAFRAKPAKFVTPAGKEVEVQIDRVVWNVITVGERQVRTTEKYDKTNSLLTAGLPEPGEGIVVYAIALVSRRPKSRRRRSRSRPGTAGSPSRRWSPSR